MAYSMHLAVVAATHVSTSVPAVDTAAAVLLVAQDNSQLASDRKVATTTFLFASQLIH